MDNTKSVFIIVLNYNGYLDTEECVASLLKVDYQSLRIVVVDNASTDNSYEKLLHLGSEKVSVIKTSINLGYAGGNNAGILYAISEGADYICVINNDTLVDSTFVNKCVAFLEQNKEYAIVAPTILNIGTDIVQSAGGRINIIKGRHQPYHRGEEYSLLRETKTVIDCQFISGCCLFFSSDLIRHIGLLPEAYFLFYEETEWCYKAIRNGYKNACITNCYIEHKDSGTVTTINGIKNYLLKRNRAAFVRRNGNAVQLIFFIVYIFSMNTIWLLKYGKTYLTDYKSYLDGLFSIIDSRYPYIVINEGIK